MPPALEGYIEDIRPPPGGMLIPPDEAENGVPEREGGGGPDGPYGLLPGIIMPAEGGILEPIGPPIRELDGIC